MTQLSELTVKHVLMVASRRFLHWLPDGVMTSVCLFSRVLRIPFVFDLFARMQHDTIVYGTREIVANRLMGNRGTSAMTPFVLTPSGSCQPTADLHAQVI